MLARVRDLPHPNSDFTIDLPLLIPSFTSKGFGVKTYKGNERSEIAGTYDTFGGEYIKNSMLISAYDIHHENFHCPENHYSSKEIIFIDSGGYELCKGYDSTEVNCTPHKAKRFVSGDYIKVLEGMPDNLPVVITNFDWGTKDQGISEQIEAAQELFNRHPNFLHNFIVKTCKKNKLNIAEVIQNIKKFRRFHVLGVTEKELGDDLLDRLINIAKIRTAMDREGVTIPIHIYGGLDPTITPLYFFVGAEIFDGVSWLRYAYKDGVAIYHHAHSILTDDLGLEASAYQAFHKRIAGNITSLQRQTTNLQNFVNSRAKCFDMFGVNSQKYRRAYEVLTTKIHELKGDI